MKLFYSLKKIFIHPASLATWMVSTLVVGYIWYRYSDVKFVAANYQSFAFAYFDVYLSWMMIFLFPILLASVVYKSFLFGKKVSHKKSGIFGFLSGILSTFITGCTCCGVSLLSVFGLTSVISFLEVLPYHGIELKTGAILLLCYSTYDALIHIDNCQIKKR